MTEHEVIDQAALDGFELEERDCQDASAWGWCHGNDRGWRYLEQHQATNWMRDRLSRGRVFVGGNAGFRQAACQRSRPSDAGPHTIAVPAVVTPVAPAGAQNAPGWTTCASYSAIARGLNTEGIPSPSQHDPARNSHRNGPGWADSAVRAILRNARYTGHEVFGRQRRDYEPIDLSSPAEGHVRRMRWNDPSSWIWSLHS